MSARRTSAAIVSAATAAVTLAATTGAGAATRATVHATPHLNFSISSSRLAVHGPRSFAAGRVAISLKAIGNEREVEIVKLRTGYSYADLRTDIRDFGMSEGPNGPSKAGLRHLNHAIDHATLYGGLDAEKGKTAHGSVVLSEAGTYIAYDDSGELPAHPMTLHVHGRPVHRASPGSHGLVKALSGDRFGGEATLPHKGTITFHNAATDSPHFLILQHVKAGTTKKDVENYFAGDQSGPPAFALAGGASTDAISPGHSQTLTYSLPKGTYVELCFFPDPVTGMPHALMGMIKIVTLK